MAKQTNHEYRDNIIGILLGFVVLMASFILFMPLVEHSIDQQNKDCGYKNYTEIKANCSAVPDCNLCKPYQEDMPLLPTILMVGILVVVIAACTYDSRPKRNRE